MKTAAEPRRRFELNDLLHPEQAFGHPSDIVADPDLTVNEQRAILAWWAWDCHATDVMDAILEALRALDQFADPAATERNLRDWSRRQARRRSIERFRRRRGGDADRGLPR
jgi:hypothetical protein